MKPRMSLARARRATVAFAVGCAMMCWRTPAHGQGRSDATWYPLDPPTASSVIAADESGMWTRDGTHYRVDGKLDVRVKVRPLLKEIRFAATGPHGPLVAGMFEGEHSLGAALIASDRQGKQRWRVVVGDESPKNSITGLDALHVDAAGNVFLAGRFSGCIGFGTGADRKCVDEKVARRNSLCEGEHCEQPFVAAYDSNGNLRTAFAVPGYPSRFVAGASDGRIALGGSFIGSLDLDPDAKREVMVRNTSATKKSASQAFWTVFRGGSGLEFVNAHAVIGYASTNVEGLAFSSDGALAVVVRVQGAETGHPTLLTDGNASLPFSASSLRGCVLMTVPSVGAPPPPLPLELDPPRPNADFLFLPTRQGGMFAFGSLRVPPGTMRVEPLRPGQPESAIVGVYGTGKGWAVKVPSGIEPAAALIDGERVCLGFKLLGQHQLPGVTGTMKLGDNDATTSAIGCFRLSPSSKQGGR